MEDHGVGLIPILINTTADNGTGNSLSSPMLSHEMTDSPVHKGDPFTSKPLSRPLSTATDLGVLEQTFWLDDESYSARKLHGVCSDYQEAAIYLREGKENEKLYYHPSSPTSYWAYMVLHNPIYYIAEFAASLMLMLLAFLEEPTFLSVEIWVAPVVEILLLLFLSSDFIFKLMWIKPKFLLKHYRTILKCVAWAVMFADAVVVLGQNKSHFRGTRALRPLFLLDTNLLTGVRRLLRQILQCMGQIADVLCQMFFFILIFAISGYYLFATDSPTNFQFRLLRESLISLYITSTTANFPDVMMESYNRQSFAPLFFIIFLIITLYIIPSVLLAVVYSTFQNIQRSKFRELYLHKRNALRHVFNLLAINGNKQKVLPLESYLNVMEHYSPLSSKLHGICTYKAMLNQDRMINDDESLSLDEFYKFYDFQRLSWNRVTGYGKKVRWYSIFQGKIYTCFNFLTVVVSSVYFNVLINLIILSNLLYFYVITSRIEDPINRFDIANGGTLNINFAYIIIYLLEIFIKVMGLGPVYYIRSYWNIFDCIVIITSFIIQLFEIGDHYLVFIIPLRFLRLIRFNKRLRAIYNTLAILFPQIINIVVLLMLIYYFYAIIGMEILSGEVEPGCCNLLNGTTGVQDYYTGNGSNVFYLNNFDSISQSYVTLFELMVVNNWWIIMEGFHAGSGRRSTRAFFIFFHLTTSVVINVAIAFIVEAFALKIELARQKYITRKEALKRPYWSWELPYVARKEVTVVVSLLFEGLKRHTKGDIHQQLYKDHLEKWIEEDEVIGQSAEFLFNQLPQKSSFSLMQQLKDNVLLLIMYIFD
ncbi:two pore channel protein 1-like isoform X2 [Dysidea avara]|uniref:two pore channel protein 1-like isoform X2 n=1 Tax=Dysidea avara TaxID=196820 RepID=UPI00331A4E1A